jgi:hypothetical protein
LFIKRINENETEQKHCKTLEMGVDVMLTSFGDFHILQIYTKSKLAKILGINIHKAAQWGLFILSSFLNYRSSPHFCATVFLGVDFVLILTKKTGWDSFWAIFHKLIWSPCQIKL